MKIFLLGLVCLSLSGCITFQQKVKYQACINECFKAAFVYFPSPISISGLIKSCDKYLEINETP